MAGVLNRASEMALAYIHGIYDTEPISSKLVNKQLQRNIAMPMIDVYAPDGLFPKGTERQLAQELTTALLHAEGVATPGPAHLHNTAAYIHKLETSSVHTAATESAKTVRIQIITPPGALNRAGQKSSWRKRPKSLQK